MSSRTLQLLAVVVSAAAIVGCDPVNSSPVAPSAAVSTAPSETATATATATDPPLRVRSLVIVGRIVTMAQPPIAEALFIENGIVAAVGSREAVLAAAGDEVPIINLGRSVAYPGFIDSHAHWIGDRQIYGVTSASEAVAIAVKRGWTSISEQAVNRDRLDELAELAEYDLLLPRVDGYLMLNFEDEFLGDWFVDFEPSRLEERLRIQGVKVHGDNGAGTTVNWDPDELSGTIGRANAAGWQVSVHSMSSAALELALDAFEAALGPSGPNPLHHRIEHAAEVTDEQLARMVALDLTVVFHPDGEPDWIMYDEFLAEFDRDAPPAEIEAHVGRWRDFVDAGLHVAVSTDAPWTFPDFQLGDQFVDLTDAMGRPTDHIAAAMDGKQRMNPEMPSWLLDQTLTAEQALRAVTVEAAWALGDDGRRGHLAPGTFGDVTILSGDILSATPDEIRDLTVIATIVGGLPVHCVGEELCPSFER